MLKKSNDNAQWVPADSFTKEVLENGHERILAICNGIKFIDFNRRVMFTNSGWGFYYAKDILIQNEKAFINANAYKSGYKIIQQQ